MKEMTGTGDWERTLRRLGEQVAPDCWQDFRPVSEEDISRVERAVCRTLPEDFRRFWLAIGAGHFSDRILGNIYTPDDVIIACHGPLLMALGSSPWAAADEQRRFYATHGSFNPSPERFTPGVTFLEGIDLLDLLQVGTNGLCCYHQLFVGSQPAPFGYALLTPERILDQRQPSFLAGMESWLNDCLRDPENDEED